MAVKASPEVIRNMEKQMRNTINEINQISSEITSIRKNALGWNDSKAAEFDDVMKRIAKLSSQPVQTLKDAIPKLEKLAQALDQYRRIRF